MPPYRSDAPDVAPSFRQRFEEDGAPTAAMLAPKAETSELGGVSARDRAWATKRDAWQQ